MKTLRLFLVSLLIASTSLFATSVANAGQLSTSGASISWDESTFYIPKDCTRYNFSYSATNKVNLANIKITNKFNDEIGSTIFFGPNSGSVSVQVCDNNDFTGTKVDLIVRGSVTYGGTDGIVSTPITFLSRSGSTSATPAPAATVYVTATPAPAATVYVTNPADQTLKDLNNSLKAQVTLLNAKLKKICAAKPKPKGC